MDILPLRVIYHYKLAHAVPLEGSATYAEIARQSGLREDLVFRFVRAAMSNHIFDEDPATGHVRHTAVSRLLATNSGFADGIGVQIEEHAPASTRVIDAWNKWGQDANEPYQTAFALLNQMEAPTFEILAKYPERARRFDGAMQFWTADDSWDLRHMLNTYDWEALDRPGALVVDIGGGKGQVSQFLARHTLYIRFQVQDLLHVVPSAVKELPAELAERVEFKAHNFLEPQPSTPPSDAFLLRWILHNWPDAYCMRLLRALVPAMRPGVKLLIYELVTPDAPVRDLTGRIVTQMDIMMASCFGGRERRRLDFEILLRQSDERFVLEAIRRSEGATMSMVEVGWKP